MSGEQYNHTCTNLAVDGRNGFSKPIKVREPELLTDIARGRNWLAESYTKGDKRSDRYMPAWRSLSSTGWAWGILPRNFAVTMRPRTPLTGIPSSAAQRRPARSS